MTAAGRMDRRAARDPGDAVAPTFARSAGGLRYEICGQGPDLVLVHEMGGSLESFDTLSALLATRFRILRYDQRGAGGSARAPRGMTIADHARDLADLLGETGITQVRCLLGIAAGAAVAVSHVAMCQVAMSQVAVSHVAPSHVATSHVATSPLEMGGAPEALILCAPALSVPPERRAYLEARSDLARREGMAAVTEASLARSYPDRMRGDAQRYARYRARFLANDPDDYADANMALAASRVPDLLPSLALPCLVLAGRHDLLRPPEEVRQTCALIPGARYGEIESGHLMSVQAPEALAAGILDFLGERDD